MSEPGEPGEAELALAAAKEAIRIEDEQRAAQGNAPQAPLIGLAGALRVFNLCGCTEDPQRNGLRDEGLESIWDFGDHSPHDIDEVAKTLHGLTVARGGARIGLGIRRRLKAACRFVAEMKRSGVRRAELDARWITDRVLDDAVARLRVEEEAQDLPADDSIKAPPKFKPENWIKWKDSFHNCLDTIASVMPGLPLRYLLRKATMPTQDELNAMTPAMRAWYRVRLSGAQFARDDKKLWTILKGFLVNTDAWAWISEFDKAQRGRPAWIALSEHYDGKSQVAKRLAWASATIKGLRYRQEKVFSWENYSRLMTEAFQVQKDNGSATPASEQVRTLLEQIDEHAPQYVQMGKTNCMMKTRLSNDLQGTINEMAELIAKVTSPGPGQGNGRNRSVAATDAAQRPGGNRGTGRGGGNRRNANMVNGIDVSNPGRSFTPEEWGTLSDAGYLPTLRNRRRQARNSQRHDPRNNRRNNRNRNFGSGGNSRNGNNGNQNPRPPSLRSQVASLNANLAALQGQMNANNAPNSVVNNGNNNAAAGNDANANDNNSQLTATQNGARFGSGAYNNANNSQSGRRQRQRRFSAVTSGPRVAISLVQRADVATHAPDVVGRLESDSHADTSVAGANFTPIAFTNHSCDVQPFSDKYAPVKNVPIATAGTAYDNPNTGETLILVVHQVLWMPDMPNSLLNPNQVRSCGVQFCDDPYDPHRSLGLYDPKTRRTIPFDVQNGWVGLKTRSPTHRELEECAHIHLTSDEPWDPKAPHLPHNRRSDEEETVALISSIRSD